MSGCQQFDYSRDNKDCWLGYNGPITYGGGCSNYNSYEKSTSGDCANVKDPEDVK